MLMAFFVREFHPCVQGPQRAPFMLCAADVSNNLQGNNSFQEGTIIAEV